MVVKFVHKLFEMKNMILFSTILLLFFIAPTFGQSHIDDSTHMKEREGPVTTMISFYEMTYFIGEKKFNLSGEINFGGRVFINTFSPKIVTTLGGRVWLEVGDTKFFGTSRSWVNYNNHLGYGVLYRGRIGKNSTFYIGPAMSAIYHFKGGVPKGPENYKYLAFSKKIEDQVPWIRGNYFAMPYVFFQIQNNNGILAELNFLIPAKKYPFPMSIGQPNGTLIPAVRAKFQMESGRMKSVFDFQIPVLSGSGKVEYLPNGQIDYDSQSSSAGYRNFRLMDSTGKIEFGYRLINFTSSALSAFVGYKREWHVLNFPLLLDEPGEGTWSTSYVKIRLDFVSFKFKKSKSKPTTNKFY